MIDRDLRNVGQSARYEPVRRYSESGSKYSHGDTHRGLPHATLYFGPSKGRTFRPTRRGVNPDAIDDIGVSDAVGARPSIASLCEPAEKPGVRCLGVEDGC